MDIWSRPGLWRANLRDFGGINGCVYKFGRLGACNEPIPGCAFSGHRDRSVRSDGYSRILLEEVARH